MNPLFNIDFYKAVHADQYPPQIKKIVSYFTPRMTRLPDEDRLTFFGLQGFIKDYLIKEFNDNFFGKPKYEILESQTGYKTILDATLGQDAYSIHRIDELHDLGYLPIEIKALPEGSRVNIKVPMIEISNTHPDFAWLVGALETMMSTSLWHTMISANVGYRYRQIVNKYYDLTVDDNVPKSRALGDFSMRGQESIESAAKSSAAFCLSFLNTATVPAILYLMRNYNCDPTTEPVAFGAISTEHSVMCSNYAIDGDERTFVKRLLTKIYPNQSFSMVSDSYDYWNMVDNILPSLKEEIMNHNGTFLVRGDSGDPVEIVTNTVFRLWESFGGTINTKGYKVLDQHIKAIYGDSITPERCETIYRILTNNGFACNNVALGVGSFSMQCLEHIDDRHDIYYPYTRDTYGIAMKATYAEDDKGTPIMIFKDPKTDYDRFKRSQRGCCVVHKTHNGNFSCIDGLTSAQRDADENNCLKTVFKDGKMVHETDLKTVRSILNGGSF